MEKIITYRYKIMAILLLIWAGMNFLVFPPEWLWAAVACLLVVLVTSVKLFRAKP